MIPITIKEEVDLILKSVDKIDSLLLSYDELPFRRQEEENEKSRINAIRFIRNLLSKEGKSCKEVRNVLIELRTAFIY